jgi:ketosteroid isomerase-like protein
MRALPRSLLLAMTLAAGLAVGWLAGRLDLTAQATDDPDALGLEQVQRFYTAIETGQGLEALLADSFQLIRTDGSTYDRAAYLAGASSLQRFSLSDVKALRSGDTLTVTFRASFAGTVGGVVQEAEALPRMAVFEQQEGAWKMVAYANLGQGSGEVAAEAERALQSFFDATYSQDPAQVRALLAPEFQLARSDGTGFLGASYADHLPTFTQRAQVSDLVASGFGEILVVRYRVAIGLVIDGKQAEAVSPRLTVFRRANGRWLVVAHANFARLEQ